MAIDIKSIGVIGAGQMGEGIAQVYAQSGFSVKLSDLDGKVLVKAIDGIRSRLLRQVKSKRITHDILEQTLANIETATDYKIAVVVRCNEHLQARNSASAIHSLGWNGERRNP